MESLLDRGFLFWSVVLLLAVSTLFINAYDYVTTLYGVGIKAGYELNPEARALLENGDLITLAYDKAIYVLLMWAVLLGGAFIYENGRRMNSEFWKGVGMIMIFIFAVMYIGLMIVITLNLASMF